MLYLPLPDYPPETPDPEDVMIDDYYNRLAQKEYDKWELTAYFNASNGQGN